MKKSLVFLAAVTLAFGTVSVIANDKKTADPAAAPAAPAATPAAAPAAAPAADSTTAPAATAATAKKQTICPKCKSKIDKKFYVNSDGKKIYFCGSNICSGKIKKDIAGVVSKLEADGITLDTVEKKAEKEKKK